jgi:hypothetical protein
MLLNLKKDFENGDVVSIKLINGDEIIARYESEDEHTVTISRPLAITMSPQGMGLIPWVFLGVDESVTLRKKNTFFIVASKGEAAKQYTEGTTGIALVK